MALLTEADRVLVDGCEWRTMYRKDGSSYRKRTSDCQDSTCKWSDSYVPPS